ncbi:MAG: 50S ribosomal protein L11 methyltransferase [Proteobacteria bacterium]|nr:50S ribosomal protein L11 methyltransferase [Pseudomonadota bacterium]
MPKEKWIKITLSTPPELVDPLSNFITEMGAQGIFQEEPDPATPDDFPKATDREELVAYLPSDTHAEDRITSLKAYLDSLSEVFPELDKPDLSTETVIDPGWGEQWKKYFKPLRISRDIVVKPTWERYTPTGRDIVIEIDPGMAFGTGQHPSTRMCVEALENILLKDRTIEKWRVLDVGTGTGILGISCAKLGAERVVCLDIDTKAVEIAAKNASINRVEDRVKIINEDVSMYDDTFDLIVANLTAKMLLTLRSHLISMLETGGYLVISGIIDQDRKIIEDHFLTGDITLHSVITEKEWVCYLLKKGNSSATKTPRHQDLI